MRVVLPEIKPMGLVSQGDCIVGMAFATAETVENDEQYGGQSGLAMHAGILARPVVRGGSPGFYYISLAIAL